MYKVFVFICTFAAFAAAQEYHVTRTHYIALGLDATFNTGDFDGKGTYKIDSDKDPETVYNPYLGTFFVPSIELGANLNQHTVSLVFGMWKPKTNYGKNTDEYTENTANFWRISIAYRYNFFWPENFQIGPGIDYTFARLSVNKSAFGKDKYGDETRGGTVHSGNGFTPSINIRYFFGSGLGMDAAIRYRLMYYRYVTTPANGFCNLDNANWEHTAEIGIKLFYQF